MSDIELGVTAKQVDPYNNVTTITAQPVPVNSYSTATVARIYNPVNEQTVQSNILLNNNGSDNVNARRRPPPGQWSDSICDWPSNLFPSCWCACCCLQGMWLVGQMSKKTGHSQFKYILGSYAVVWLVAIILQLAVGASFVIWMPAIFASFTAISLRMHIANRDGINGIGPCGECCVGFWCWYCSVAQMARHVYGYTKVFDGDSEIDKPDYYTV
mmetsp:Transcript_21441/g.19513  ORF Transcript_21441/g.19513 Transcript_21441/m.19513 type:complete len:214 (+) Transcript_21441:144-785(+)